MTAILPPFVLTFDDGDHCLLALCLPTEDGQNAALLEVMWVKQMREYMARRMAQRQGAEK